MGSFSWLRADEARNSDDLYRNIYGGCPFKCLIPKEFGGGAIEDSGYQDYGYLGYKENGNEKYDMYELLAIWNADSEVEHYDSETRQVERGTIRYFCQKLFGIDVSKCPLKEIDGNTGKIRLWGIHIACYDKQIDKIKYPLKLVHIDYEGTYEDCENRSYGDPQQGFYPVRWDGTDDYDYDYDEEEEF